MNSTYPAVDYFIRIYGGLILFTGIPANIICIIVLGTDTTNRITTRTFMVLLAISDCLVLMTAVSHYWIRRVFGFWFRDFNPAICKVHHHLVGVFSDFAVGMLCSLAVERFLVVAFPHNASGIVTKKSIFIGMLIFIFCVIAKNSIHFYIFDIIYVNASSKYACKYIPSKVHAVKIFLKVDFVTYSVIPYCVLFFCNVYIYLALRRQGRILNKAKKRNHDDTNSNNAALEEGSKKMLAGKNEKNVVPAPAPVRKKRRPQSVIKVLVALSVLHFVTTLPGTTMTFLKVYIGAKGGSRFRLVHETMLLLLFTNNAINFIAYFASSRSFRKRLKTIFCHRFGFCKTTEDNNDQRLGVRRKNDGRTMNTTAMVTML